MQSEPLQAYEIIDGYQDGKDFPGCQASGVDLHSNLLDDICLDGASLEGADLSESSFKKASFVGARLIDANLANADLSGADLRRADLTGADLRGAWLDEAKLDGAVLILAKLQGAYLATCSVKDARFDEAKTAAIWEPIGAAHAADSARNASPLDNETALLDRTGPFLQEPSVASWTKIWRAINNVPDEQLGALLPVMNEQLESWPDELREAPGDWLSDVWCESPAERLALARSAVVGFETADNLDLLAACPQASVLTRLELASCKLPKKTLKAIATSEHLEGVRHLKIANCSLSKTAATELAMFPALQSLDLEREKKFGDDGVARLAKLLPRLTQLRLDHIETGSGGLSKLFDAETAELRCLTVRYPDNGLPGIVGASGRLEGLQQLVLVGCGDDDSPESNLGLLKDLVRDHNLPSLRSLELAQWCGEGGCDELVVRLKRSTLLAHLRHLRLDMPISNEGFARLLAAPNFGIESLRLHGSAMTDAGLQEFAQSDSAATLRELHLDYAEQLTDASLRALTASAQLSSLRSLALPLAKAMTPAGVAFFEQSTFAGLERLDLSNNPQATSADAMAALARAPFAPNLKELDLSDNDLSVEALIALLRPRTFSSLRRLNLKGNVISCVGGHALTRCLMEWQRPGLWEVSEIAATASHELGEDPFLAALSGRKA